MESYKFVQRNNTGPALKLSLSQNTSENRFGSLQVRSVHRHLGLSGREVVVIVESEVVEESGVHHHRPHDVNAAEDDRAVDGATGDAEAVDAANDRESYKEREWLGWGLHST